MGVFDFLFGGKKIPQENKPVDDPRLLEEVEIIPGLKLPRAFALQWDDLSKNKIDYIEITATPTDDLALEQSKFGYYPCMPADFEYPVDDHGKFMFPLAQINFKEVPALAGYPDAGYLQFYISVFDELFGLDFDQPQRQKNFRILYFTESEVEKYKVDFSFLDETMESELSPVPKPYALGFTKKEEYIGLGDVRYEEDNPYNAKEVIKKYPLLEADLEDALYESSLTGGHKIGGYAHFSQEDPRNGTDFKNYALLFQLDSDDEIMWGDSGVANFFIDPQDLVEKNFSKVIYNWDCY